MNPSDFLRWPLLVSSRRLIELGLTEKQLRRLRVVIRAADQRVSPGYLGWVADHPGSRKGKWRKTDVARLLGIEI